MKQTHGNLKHCDNTIKAIIVLRRYQYTYKQIAKKVGIPVHTVPKICYREELLEISQEDELEIVSQFELEEFNDSEEQLEKWIDEKLVSKYAAKGEYDWLSVYFIQRYNVTHLTAKRIYLQLQALKRKSNEKASQTTQMG